MAIDRWAVAFNITKMGKTLKEIFVCFSYLVRLDSGKLSKSATSMAEAIFKADAIRKHSVLLDDSDFEGMDKSTERNNIKETAEVEDEFFELFTINSQRNQKEKNYKI